MSSRRAPMSDCAYRTAVRATLSRPAPSRVRLRSSPVAGASLVLQIVGSSSLSGMEYARYRLYADAALHAPMAVLAERGTEVVATLQALCDKPQRLATLLRLLVHAHVLYCDDDAEAASVGSAEGTGLQAGAVTSNGASQAGKRQKRGRESR
eukprot:1981098-Prymnesium_polylepis.1